MPALQSLYQEVILQHYRSPRNKGELEDADVQIEMRNPVCGDEITLHLRVEEGTISDVRFSGQGCSISQASASMMTDRLRGRSVSEAERLGDRFKEMMHGDKEAARDKELGDLRALAGVAKFPVRIKCAMLIWDALNEARKEMDEEA